MGAVDQLSLRHVHSKNVKKNIFGGKRGLMWLHTYGKRRSYIEREKHSNFRKWGEIKERKVDFLQQIEFLAGWYKYIKKNEELKKGRKEKKKENGGFSFLGQI